MALPARRAGWSHDWLHRWSHEGGKKRATTVPCSWQVTRTAGQQGSRGLPLQPRSSARQLDCQSRHRHTYRYRASLSSTMRAREPARHYVSITPSTGTHDRPLSDLSQLAHEFSRLTVTRRGRKRIDRDGLAKVQLFSGVVASVGGRWRRFLPLTWTQSSRMGFCWPCTCPRRCAARKCIGAGRRNCFRGGVLGGSDSA